MYYHASKTAGITELMPNVSNHGVPLVYLSCKRENTLVYLSNAVEKFCRESNYGHKGKYYKWASYGFTPEGILRIEEYYPDATIETYKGESGYIYQIEHIDKCEKQKDIPDSIITGSIVPVTGCEFISDAYGAIMDAVAKGEIILQKYEDNSENKISWIKSTIRGEYERADQYPEYKAFLEAKFSSLLL